MKASILVPLIVCGTLLLMTPMFFDHMHERSMVEIATRTTAVADGVTLQLGGRMDSTYRGVLWVAGGLVLAIGAIGGVLGFVRECWQMPGRS